MWDKIQACKLLSIPYRVINMDKYIGGYTAIGDRFIHINESMQDDDRVWIHELAHAVLHFKQFSTAAGLGDKTANAHAELEADTVAYVVTTTLGLENKDYIRYIRSFMHNIPIREIYGTILNEADWNKIKQTALLILQAGGYYD